MMKKRNVYICAATSGMLLLALLGYRPIRLEIFRMNGETARVKQAFAQTETICFGRLAVDVPSGSTVSWGEMLAPWKIVTTPGKGQDYSNEAAQLATRLKGEKVMMTDEYAFRSIEDISQPPGKVVVGVQDIGGPGILAVNGYF